ncbi:hypothetical protein BDK92_7296 [Micromonospora pisi]|uniref:Uncharacterized protein n=1 Tax=Micromonospora pisi TaxID=589240 RepID=A0A495JX24_9ACTN|nr:hypothetical protein [Micromonospora pisi]RKR92814.1 hypothetical protein BDK92_7296 [Micromonospora pisi]
MTITRTRVRTAPDTTTTDLPTTMCRCPYGRPTLIARWESEHLVSVRRRHWYHCGLPQELVNIPEWLAGGR